ncbi:hypothetical protein QFZ56_008068 [Streptomyces achromogenes]|uniref:Uncharacterized protein n=1 Tax=Streptomyces achromogenes TaxID=67255 RepID=A0ABU0QED7_STRAH|nr:hypothetical protein [Streptomyces achromogenes]MDQ0689022.1 hypothetical protein [Streptomyces achromogenes]
MTNREAEKGPAMDTKPDLKLVGMAHVDGQELLCGECGNGFSLEIHKHGFREVSPAWICCLSCGKGEDSRVITNGLVDAVLAGWLKRQKDADRDVFTAEWRGIVMTGELYPTFDIYQAVGAAKAVHEVAAPEVKKWWRSKKKAAKAQVKEKAGAVTGAAKGKAKETADTVKEKAGEAASSAKATAISTAWTLQTGGAGPTTSVKPKRQRCTVKGCRGGKVTISTRVHSSTGKTREVKIPCGVCHRSST